MKEKKLRIHLWNEDVLRKSCRPVEEVNEEVCQLLDQMYTLMQVSDGVGLAANQAGLDLCLVVIQTESRPLKLVNPKIIKREGRVRLEEGCLSFPGISLLVNRAKKVWVTSLDQKGNPFDLEAEGTLAVVLQHEIDHINGIVFIDRIPFLKRMRLKGKLHEIKKKVKNEM